MTGMIEGKKSKKCYDAAVTTVAYSNPIKLTVRTTGNGTHVSALIPLFSTAVGGTAFSLPWLRLPRFGGQPSGYASAWAGSDSGLSPPEDVLARGLSLTSPQLCACR